MEFFSNPVQFEKVLLNAADRTLGRNAVTSRNERLGGIGAIWELDFIFEPDLSDGRIYIFEFKYTSSPTLADSTVLTQIARFESLRNANTERSLGFLLVTNGIVRRNFNIPKSVFILDEIKAVNAWQEKIADWARKEIPQWSTKSLHVT
ncbi:hypothetical protein G3N59_35450 [Paraburkholderia sp. Ac-20340]|uniref:hypothetical protein n=1 Tax=Paraburkholderia sp. Ac-20340 TaxID=2703888 RepID=UPI00197D5C9C|nr:hypothetical protein [Paraburkholderia sp. Ac-20340]MBN3858700.1 hypothetical protein [Paraburkholderia sp. Ac-20340]